METSEVRNRLHLTMERAKRQAADRRTRTDAASRAFDAFLAHTAVPLCRQIVNVLRVDGYPFAVSTPAGSVRMMSDRTGEDYLELALDTSGEAPRVVGRTSRRRGGDVMTSEQVIGSGDPEAISEEELFAFLLKELEPFVER